MMQAMSDPNPSFPNLPKLEQGPYELTESTSYTLSPITVTITRSTKSSHVPPPERPCGCGGGGGMDIGAIIEMLGKSAFSAVTQPPPPADDDHEH